MDKNLNMNQLWLCALAALKVSCILGCISESIASSIYFALLRWHLEYVMIDNGVLEQVQWRSTKMMRGLEHVMDKEKLKEIGLFILKK